MTDEAVLRESEAGLTLLRLSRPEKMNALTEEVKAALNVLVSDFFADPAQRCLIITGSGKAFCAGGDLRTLASGSTPAQTRDRMARSHGWAHQLLAGGKPVIMAVNGAAAGAGFGLALMGDIIIASEAAYFLPGFVQAGVAADLGVALTLPRAVGMVRAKDILFNNRRISGVDAAAMGLVSQTVAADDLMPTALAVGERLASGPTLALGLTKSLLNQSYELPLPGFLAAETAAQTVAFASADCIEGVDAFFGRRAPDFHGN
ncbi:MAG: enoyl-CoA hydratase [Bradyrhizobium sp.]|nr:enoyl-CoA hydratase [Bradyrhizobium sp.]